MTIVLSWVKTSIRGSWLEGAAARTLGRFRPQVRLRYEWHLRIKRDTRAMREIISRELRGSAAAVDVGANLGEITGWLFDSSPLGVHHVIEPLPELAADLRRRFPRAVVHECAASDTPGEAAFFHVVDSPGWSGLRRQSIVSDKKTVTINVAVQRLDDLIGDSKVSLIKIDVEGAELGVLRGATGVLARDRPIILFEHAPIHAENFSTTSGQVWDVLHEAGYRISPVAEPSMLLPRDKFIRMNQVSHSSGYDRHAWTNWIAAPAPTRITNA